MSTTPSSETNFMDIMDGIVRARGSIGYIADNSQDPQLTSLLMLIEESLESTENSLQYLIEQGQEEELNQ